ncbi:XdhC family protein [Pseudazoarcus pumilus]|uniref:Xanthine dehydrogenase n=1 Tax=Pseudazoarcus pumilus TaxID=2067960 RepID=A0A2I6S7I3_9RHOO|nr:XdhC/CoxI family protein [Pseudazoarcus pumilus]AUN95208.1 xanthine dehydrogenase [Pseudazoarcus pumilus]
MKEVPLILDAWKRALDAGDEAVLATVVRIAGSSYRKPGARMLITSDGRNIGTVSGGCLERHLVERAWWLTEEGAVLCRFDTRADEDAQWSFGLGCNGEVHVLLERVGAHHAREAFDALCAVRETMRPAATAVVIAADAGGGAQVGERLLLMPDGTLASRVEDPALADRMAAMLREDGRWPRYRRLACGAGSVEVACERMMPPQRLVVFGAGHDAVPLVSFAKALGWHVSVADARAQYARRARFPAADRVTSMGPDTTLEQCGVTPQAAVVVMTHSIEQDRALLARLLATPRSYVGQLGPMERTERMLCEIRDAGGAPLYTDGLHYPVGLDIGADNPEEIALAIVAEIRAHFAGRAEAATGSVRRARTVAS